MTWDLLIKAGRVVDGAGMPSFTADVAVRDGRVARIGRVDGAARRVIDAEDYAATIVNGEVLLEGGEATGALPGSLLRGG